MSWPCGTHPGDPPAALPMAAGPQEQWGQTPPTAPRARTGVTLTCRTRVLRVTRSMGLYSSAAGREEASAAAGTPAPLPPVRASTASRGGKEGRPDAQRPPPQVFMEPWASIWAPFCTEPVTAGPPPYCQEQEKPELGWCVEQGQSPVVPRGQGTMGTPIPPPCPPPFCCHRSQRAKPDTPS